MNTVKHLIDFLTNDFKGDEVIAWQFYTREDVAMNFDIEVEQVSDEMMDAVHDDMAFREFDAYDYSDYIENAPTKRVLTQ